MFKIGPRNIVGRLHALLPLTRTYRIHSLDVHGINVLESTVFGFVKKEKHENCESRAAYCKDKAVKVADAIDYKRSTAVC